MIDPALDGWVWATALLLLAVLGARAWVVETGQGRLARTPARVRVLTGTSAAVLVVLVVLLTIQGGAQLAGALITGSDPAVAAVGGSGEPSIR